MEYEEKLLSEQHKQKHLSREKEGLKVGHGRSVSAGCALCVILCISDGGLV